MQNRLPPLGQLAPAPGGLLHHLIGATSGFSPTVAAVLYAVYASGRLVSLFLSGAASGGMWKTRLHWPSARPRPTGS